MEAGLTKSIRIKNSYADILSSFNDDLQSAVDAALQRYLIDEIAGKITELKKKERGFQKKYDCDYKTFALRTAEDEKYIEHIETTITQLWEMDLTDWEFCTKGIDREKICREKCPASSFAGQKAYRADRGNGIFRFR